MRNYWHIAKLLAIAVAIPLTARADIIELQDGQTISGSMKRVGDQMVITADDGTTLQAKPDDITKVTLTATAAEQAAVTWSVFTSDVARADDIATIIFFHQQFLAADPRSPHHNEVKDSLASYQQLAQQNPVKFHGRWMPSAEVPVLLQQWKDAAAPARAAYKAGNLNAAVAAAMQALTRDAENPDALEIAGLASLRMDHLAEAQNDFQKLAATNPGTGLAWHNLAVINLLQNRQAQALPDFSRALESMPQNRLLLDNIAGFLANFTGDTNTAAYQTLARQYTQAESREQSAMATQGLYRYGTAWISQSLLTQYAARDAQLAQDMQHAGELGKEPMDAASSARLAAYEQALIAVDQSRRAFVPRFMDLGEDQAPPPPVALANPAPLPSLPLLLPPSAPLPDTSQVTIADNTDDSQTVDLDSTDSPGIPFSPGRHARHNPAENRPHPDAPSVPQPVVPAQPQKPREGPFLWRSPRDSAPPVITPVQPPPAPTAPIGGGGTETSPYPSNDRGHR